MNDLIVQFAILWGETMSSALTPEKIAEEMKQYDSEEVLKILSGWAEEYLKLDDVYVEDFFDDKINALGVNDVFPETIKETVARNLAIAAVEHSIFCDLEILTENWDSADDYFMETFGCTLEAAEKALDCKFNIRECWENEE